ncbi:hypothetical protein HDV00_002155 [Rhizophlyctis rosea]|nr:hypothetical protein HDV00_002155 [Rhizophlyctis rosea]
MPAAGCPSGPGNYDMLIASAVHAVRRRFPNVLREVIKRLEVISANRDSTRRDPTIVLTTAVDMIHQSKDDGEIAAAKQIVSICLRSPLFSLQQLSRTISNCVQNIHPIILRELLSACPDQTRDRIRSLDVFPSNPTLDILQLLLENGWSGDLDCCERFVEDVPRRVYICEKREEPAAAVDNSDLIDYEDDLIDYEDEDDYNPVGDYTGEGGQTSNAVTKPDINAEELPGILELLVGHGLDIADGSLVKRTVMSCFNVGNDRVTKVVLDALRGCGAVVDETVIRKALRRVPAGGEGVEAFVAGALPVNGNSQSDESPSVQPMSTDHATSVAHPAPHPAFQPPYQTTSSDILKPFFVPQEENIFRCALCGKLFGGEEFVVRHVGNVHGEMVRDAESRGGGGGGASMDLDS